MARLLCFAEWKDGPSWEMPVRRVKLGATRPL